MTDETTKPKRIFISENWMKIILVVLIIAIILVGLITAENSLRIAQMKQDLSDTQEFAGMKPPTKIPTTLLPNATFEPNSVILIIAPTCKFCGYTQPTLLKVMDDLNFDKSKYHIYCYPQENPDIPDADTNCTRLIQNGQAEQEITYYKNWSNWNNNQGAYIGMPSIIFVDASGKSYVRAGSLGKLEADGIIPKDSEYKDLKNKFCIYLNICK